MSWSRTTTQWRRGGSNPRPFGLESSTLPLSHCAPYWCEVKQTVQFELWNAKSPLVFLFHIWVSVQQSIRAYRRLRSACASVQSDQSWIGALSCAVPECLVKRGQTLNFFFSLWGEDPSTTMSVSLACRWWPNIECWLSSYSAIFQGIRSCDARKPYIFFFRRGPDLLPPPSSGSAHVCGVANGPMFLWMENLDSD